VIGGAVGSVGSGWVICSCMFVGCWGICVVWLGVVTLCCW